MLDTKYSTRCQYHMLDNETHEFVFTEATREAVDDWFVQMDTLLRSVPPGTVVRCLVRSTASDPLPTAYMLKSAHRWMLGNTHVPTARVIFLHRSNFYFPHAKSFIRAWQMTNGIAVRFYPAENRDEALLWLLSDN